LRIAYWSATRVRRMQTATAPAIVGQSQSRHRLCQNSDLWRNGCTCSDQRACVSLFWHYTSVEFPNQPQNARFCNIYITFINLLKRLRPTKYEIIRDIASTQHSACSDNFLNNVFVQRFLHFYLFHNKLVFTFLCSSQRLTSMVVEAVRILFIIW